MLIPTFIFKQSAVSSHQTQRGALKSTLVMAVMRARIND